MFSSRIKRRSGGLDGFARIIFLCIRDSRSIRRLSSVVCVVVMMAPHLRAQQTVDQILTLVNDEPITRIDLLWSLAMDPGAPSPAGPVSSDLLQRKLDVMIDERIVIACGTSRTSPMYLD